jgi:LysM repeat protein
MRFIAPLALIGAAVALMLLITTAGNGSGTDPDGQDRAAEKARDLGEPAKEDRKSKKGRGGDKLPQDVYIVKTGDTLGSISEKTGVPVERLEELNPGLDQFQLRADQEIKLR